MSRCYWGINGYGVCIEDIEKYIDTEKVNLKVRELNPNMKFEEDVYEDDTFYGSPYDCFGEFLSNLDDTEVLTWEDCGDCDKHYFLYEPTYPWAREANEPQSAREVEKRIVNALMKVAKSNVTPNEFKKLIGYVDDYGCG